MSQSSWRNNVAIGWQSGFNCTTGSQNTALGTNAVMSYSVLWCPSCNKTYIRHIMNTSITSYVCKCTNHLIKLNVDHKIVEKALDEKGTEYLSKEDLVEILV